MAPKSKKAATRTFYRIKVKCTRPNEPHETEENIPDTGDFIDDLNDLHVMPCYIMSIFVAGFCSHMSPLLQSFFVFVSDCCTCCS